LPTTWEHTVTLTTPRTKRQAFWRAHEDAIPLWPLELCLFQYRILLGYFCTA